MGTQITAPKQTVVDVISDISDDVLLDSNIAFLSDFIEKTYPYRSYSPKLEADIKDTLESLNKFSGLWEHSHVFTTKAVAEEFKRVADILAERLTYFKRKSELHPIYKKGRERALPEESDEMLQGVNVPKRVSLVVVNPDLSELENYPEFQESFVKTPQKRRRIPQNHFDVDLYERLVSEVGSLVGRVKNRVLRPTDRHLYELFFKLFSLLEESLVPHVKYTPEYDVVPRPYKREYKDMKGDLTLLATAFSEVSSRGVPISIFSVDKRFGNFFVDSYRFLTSNYWEGWNGAVKGISPDYIRFFVCNNSGLVLYACNLSDGNKPTRHIRRVSEEVRERGLEILKELDSYCSKVA